MKNKILKVIGIILLILAGMLMVGCEKDPILGPDDPMSTIEVLDASGGTSLPSVGIMSVPSGSDVEFTFTANSGFKPDAVSVNGELKPLVDNTFSLENISLDYYKVKPIFKMTILGEDLINGEWKLDSSSIHDLRSGVWSRYKLWGVEGNLQQQLTFFPNGKVSVVQAGIKVDTEWFLDETVNPPTLYIGTKGQEHLFGSLFYVIDKLDKEFLTLAQNNAPLVEDSTHKVDGKFFFSHHD